MKPLLILTQAALLFFIALSAAPGADSLPAAPMDSHQGKKLLVGVYLNHPFVSQTKDGYEGFCIDLWKSIAADLDLSYEVIPFTKLNELLEATSANKVDVAVGSIFITGDRLKIVDFSQPYLHGGMQIMVDEKRGSSLTKLWNGLRDSGHLTIFGIGLGIILLGTLILTLCERKWNKEFHPDWKNGLAESFYHVMSIAMTGKSTHRGLPGPLGKFLAGIWIACGVGIVAYITSSVTSVMTVNRLQSVIKGPQDLPNHHVGAISGTLGETYCVDQNLNNTLYTNLDDAVKAMLDHQIDAIVFDALSLQWYDNAHPELPITEVGSIFMKKGYGIAVPTKSDLRHDINRSLLKQQESGFVETLRKHYFGDIP